MTRILLLTAIALVVIALAAWFLLGRGVQDVPAAAVDSPYWADSDRIVEVDGVNARVRMEGPRNAPAVVMIHGFSHSLESWDDWAADLSSGYRVVRLDLPGHGLTGPDPQRRYSVDETVTFLGGVLDALDIRRASLVGNSLGGLVAWRYAAGHPDRVRALVLVAPGGYSINGVTEDPVAVPMAVNFYLTQAPQAMIGAATSALFGDPSRMDPGLPGRVHTMMRRDGVGEAMVQRLEVFTLPDPEADLARVQAPTLILWGGRDRMIPPEHGRRFDADIPESTLIVHDDLGHIPHEEAPRRTIGDVREFLEAN
ncbi:alpha/beta fold hydrolase [Maricaulis sp.]|uniref:alpha/beta fold hydrolase n=1 Tax=Maricaulis sp. TaxID=1486257 RepID=UPI0026291142|nr:alpha/beta fold hydrolase [Maricaulis sp.]